ncbi:MAG: hypothetical protein ABSH24_29895 [Bryobacteraceae bacterium]|jgi:hypothetical protein
MSRFQCHVDLREVIFKGWLPHPGPPRKDFFPESPNRAGYELFITDVPAALGNL